MEWFLPSLLSLVGVVVVAWMSKRSSEKAAKTAATSAPYGELSKRVSTLEKQVDDLRRLAYSLESDLDVVVDELWSHSQRDPEALISSRALEIVQRRRTQRIRLHHPEVPRTDVH